MEASATGTTTLKAPTLETSAAGASALKASALKSSAAEARAWPAPYISVPAISKAAPDERLAIETRTSVITGAAIVAVKPGAGADKNSAREPGRAVVSIGRASVRIIVIIAISANRRRANVDRRRRNIGWTESEADHDSLRMGIWRCDQSHSKYGEHR